MKKEIMSKLKNCQGFTMIEMILTVALTAIFFTVVALALPQWIKSYQSFVRVSYANQIADNIIEAVKEQITYSSNVKTEDPPKQLSYSYFNKQSQKSEPRTISLDEEVWKADGVIIPGFVYDTKYYMDNDVQLTAVIEPLTDSSKRVCNLTVEIKSKATHEIILTKKRSIRLYGAVSTT